MGGQDIISSPPISSSALKKQKKILLIRHHLALWLPPSSRAPLPPHPFLVHRSEFLKQSATLEGIIGGPRALCCGSYLCPFPYPDRSPA